VKRQAAEVRLTVVTLQMMRSSRKTMRNHFLTTISSCVLILSACSGNPALNPPAPASNAGNSGATGAGGSSPTANTSSASLATIYKLGRKWAYETTTQAAGITTSVTMNQEVTKIDGNKATLAVTVDAMGTKSTNTNVIDLSGTNVANVVSQSTAQGNTKTTVNWNQSAISKESITVKAGTYNATKYTASLAATGTSGSAAASNNSESTIWTSDDVGLLKSITKGSQYSVQQLPAGISLPAGITLPGQGGSTPALPGLDLSFTATTELVSVTP